MFVYAVVDSCSTCIRKSIFSLMSRLNTSTNISVQSTLNSDVYTTSELYQRSVKVLLAERKVKTPCKANGVFINKC